jgi:GT2 family glycosyltransferase
MVLSIVTLNYKKKELTVSCMESLYAQFQQEFMQDKIELIIVDNDSQDDSVDVFNQQITNKGYKNMQVIANDVNSGFGAGCNKGAAAAIGEYILFLNNDTVVRDKGIFEMAHYLATHAEVAILGGQLRNENGSLQVSTGNFYTLGNAFLLLIGGQRLGILDKSPKQIKKVDWVKGALMMIRKEVFKRLGGFDEKIFMYTEDMELCYRASSAGYAVFFYPKVTVLHKDHGSASKTFAIVNIYKNLLYFYQKHRSHNEYVIMKGMLITKAKLLILVGKLTKNANLMDTYQKALAAL